MPWPEMTVRRVVRKRVNANGVECEAADEESEASAEDATPQSGDREALIDPIDNYEVDLDHQAYLGIANLYR